MISLDPARLERAFDVVQEGVQKGEIPSAVLGIGVGAETIACHAFSPPDGEPVAADNIFAIASITKPIVATAVMQLVEDGLLVLSDPVSRYIPEFAQPGKPVVTPWHLLTHTSGMEEAGWQEPLRRSPAPAQAHFQVACHSVLHFAPGARYEYCSLSFYILAELITRLSGMPYTEYLQARIFKPLGMVDTSFNPDPAQEGRAVAIHGVGRGDAEYFRSLAHPGGGLWSTAQDLLAFGRAFLKGRADNAPVVLSPAYVDLMTQEHTGGLVEVVGGQSRPAHYGLGWSKPSRDPAQLGSPGVVAHGGMTGTQLWIDPEWDLIYVFLTNLVGDRPNVRQRSLQALYGALRRSDESRFSFL